MPFLLESDDQALEAALSFVEEFNRNGIGADGLLTVDTGTLARQTVHSARSHAAADESLTKRAKVNAKKKLLRQAGIYSDPNKARNERTREIAFLREQIEKLQIDLQLLQSRQPNGPTRMNQPNAVALFATHANSQISCMWKEQAVRQHRRREQAERGNVRLRLAIERQRKVANSLKSLMKKRSTQLTNEYASLMNLCSPQNNIVDVRDFCGDIRDFRGLFKRVDDAYRHVDAVFQSNGLARSTISPNDVHMREGVDGKFLEFSSYKILPYEMRAATEAVWEHFKGVEKHLGVGSIYSKAAKNLDEPYTIIEDFSIEIYSNSSRADYKTKQVVRRYVEEDRDIVIWVSHATPVEVKHKLLSGLSYNFLGYAITKRAPSSTVEHELIQLQLCSRISLDQDNAKTYNPDSARTLANFLIVHAAKNIVAHRESIENNLADRVLRRRLQ
ncbi:hypothetical protein L914_13888 [Phytophthora nicotianae]|uniref:M96 mating-specific protein family n=1 Tax=Phytophthora nicotianae TaxID=4792 RepID=W2MX73_PHYNI|nr:hypothetical protein L914_13888 [Phytophthora nicotianae]